ncbi:hypothetical protein AB0368_01325 [Actinoplanes sp. NPDC051475]|uniref:hypothetical protein n=1 Tax=Actinoplanes sp. NPDC051475 TaxID=3157225 RepID=UPI00344C7B28
MNTLLTRVVAGLTVAAAVAVLAGPKPLTVAGGLLLAFVLPGIAVTGALFSRRTLTAVERTVLAPALSMAVLVVAGLLIYLCRVPLDRLSWTLATGSLTLIALAVPLLLPKGALAAPAATEEQPRPVGERRSRIDLTPRDATVMAEARTIVMSVVPPEDEEQAAADEKAQRSRLVRQLLPLALVLAVLGGASWLSFGTSRETYETTVTALSAAPSGPVDASGNRVVAVSASGLVASDGPYTLTVRGTAGTTPTRRVIAPAGDGTWSEQLTLPGDQRMTVGLYRAGDTAAFRTLYISAVE